MDAQFLRGIPGTVKVVIMQEGRLICDKSVYIDNKLVQHLRLEEDEIFCGIDVTNIDLLFGTSKYGAMYHFQWSDEKGMYRNMPKKILKHYAPKCRKFGVSNLQRVEDKVYVITRNQLHRFTTSLDFDKLGDTYKLKSDQLFMSRPQILDYEIAPNLIHIIVLLEDNTVQVVDQFTSELVCIF